jgi:hypothetical protein
MGRSYKQIAAKGRYGRAEGRKSCSFFTESPFPSIVRSD